MFIWNLEKCLKLFKKVYVSSDSSYILDLARDRGAIPISRGEEFCGDVPDIPVFRHALGMMHETDGIVAVHANNPNIDPKVIKTIKDLITDGYPEAMTCYPMQDGGAYKDQHSKVNGSVRGMSRERLINYPDAYKPRPEILVVDDSIEIETLEDYNQAVCQSIPQ